MESRFKFRDIWMLIIQTTGDDDSRNGEKKGDSRDILDTKLTEFDLINVRDERRN